MITTLLLEENYKAPKELAAQARHDVSQYFELSHKAVHRTRA
jgi:hypothetical protein